MRISDYLRADFIVGQLTTLDLEGVVQEVSQHAEGAGMGPAELIAEKLLERELTHSTVMGSGLAIPHATVPGLPQPVLGIAIAPQAIQFGPEGLEPVRVFFVLLSPPGRESEHVKLLARICRLGRQEDFIARLDEAESDDDIVRVIESIDARHV